jgi:hypothetical protein
MPSAQHQVCLMAGDTVARSVNKFIYIRVGGQIRWIYPPLNKPKTLAAIPSGQIRLYNMRPTSIFLVLIVLTFGTTCDNEIIDRIADFKFETIDKESNKINLEITIRYRLKSSLEKKASRKYGRHYADSLLLPTISSVSKEVLEEYSAGEIYNYKRDEIEQRLREQTRTTFVQADIELTAFLINSVGLPEIVMQRFRKEHIERFESSMKNCIKEVKGVITIHRDNIGFYEFLVENKSYRGMLTQEEYDKMSLGDSLTIEYACEDPVFNRTKQ